MATFWEIAVHSVYRIFCLYFGLFVILVISHFGFDGGTLVLIASVPGLLLCILFSYLPENVMSRWADFFLDGKNKLGAYKTGSADLVDTQAYLKFIVDFETTKRSFVTSHFLLYEFEMQFYKPSIFTE